MSNHCTGRATEVVRILAPTGTTEPRPVCEPCLAALSRIGIRYWTVEGMARRAVLRELPTKVWAA